MCFLINNYPEIMCPCDPRDQASPLFIEHPRLIIEILPSGTEGFDCGPKAWAYRMIPELREYALVTIEQRRIGFTGAPRAATGYCAIAVQMRGSVSSARSISQIFEDLT
ncbi:hypothetical protein GWK36_12965 [Caldichromatium japonicum]|uniref:Putative restriction endonuclease domain-containing protein n=1 Tax=Caldichromatium japonicum TaxID=2699430 RepID=A0A6G7VFQ7_9GAMM|nr:Uma2 family endonuclease [Caldichromatium japonicum]QIK38740.1 hypothetical protein GWK36_12965 [Caldichromatium japonicum]